jgi:hypothetical protein
MLRNVIPRKMCGLWIAIRMVAIVRHRWEANRARQAICLGICKKEGNFDWNHYYLWLGRDGADA